MSRLKTLDQIRDELPRESFDDICEVIRQHAIEWIKFQRNVPEGFVGIATQDHKAGDVVRLMESWDEEWIMYFFGISEENLK